jgi:hypothetical protein
MNARYICFLFVFLQLTILKFPVFAGVLFNATGSHTGFGDVIGPFLLAKQYSKYESKIYFLVDERAEGILKIYLEKQGGLPSSEGNIEFVRVPDLNMLPQIELLVESFENARSAIGTAVSVVDKLRSLPNVTLTIQDLHSPYGRPFMSIDFLSTGLGKIESEGKRYYFSAAGLGTSRLGILVDNSVDIYVGKTFQEQQLLASEFFAEGSTINLLLRGQRHGNALVSFAYGVHNEIFQGNYWKPYPGQFKSYVEGLRKIKVKRKRPLVVFSPNKSELIRKALLGSGADVQIFEINEFEKLSHLDAKVTYIVSTPPLSSKQFTALTAASHLPYLIEGDSTLSAAVRLGKPFLMMKAPWGLFGIDGLSRALKESGASWARRVYPIFKDPGYDTPNFSEIEDVASDTKSFQQLRSNSRDLSSSLRSIVELVQGRTNPKMTLRRLRDPVLTYSWRLNQNQYVGSRNTIAERLVNHREKNYLEQYPVKCRTTFEVK